MRSTSPSQTSAEELNEYASSSAPTLLSGSLQQTRTARLSPVWPVALDWTVKSNLQEARLLRLPEVEVRVGLGKTAIYALIKEGRFPRPVKLGAASVWVDAEITQWMAALVMHRDAAVPA